MIVGTLALPTDHHMVNCIYMPTIFGSTMLMLCPGQKQENKHYNNTFEPICNNMVTSGMNGIFFKYSSSSCLAILDQTPIVAQQNE